VLDFAKACVDQSAAKMFPVPTSGPPEGGFYGKDGSSADAHVGEVWSISPKHGLEGTLTPSSAPSARTGPR